MPRVALKHILESRDSHSENARSILSTIQLPYVNYTKEMVTVTLRRRLLLLLQQYLQSRVR